MCDVAPRIQEQGAALVAIGNGQPWQAAALRDTARIPFTLLTDPELLSFRAAGLRRSWTRALDPRVFPAAWRAFRTGARQVSVQGDPWQLGGVFVFDRSGKLVFRHLSRFPGDHAKSEGLFRALQPLS